MRVFPWRKLLLALTILGLGAAIPAGAQSFVTFESGQVRPLALSPNGSQLLAVDTPDNTLETFDVAPGGVTHAGSIPVGLEPVAVAFRGDTEAWVVNHLSDSVSIVDLSLTPPRVVRTLLVGDEPRDIVFAGPGGNRAFITTAHRGQNSPIDPQLTTEGVGRADVWVFDATALGSSLGGDPLTIVTLFGDTPRALTVSPDGNTVYAAIFESGNQTTSVSEGAVCNTSATRINNGTVQPACSIFGVTMPGGLPLPHKNIEGIAAPETGLIVKYDPTLSRWNDNIGRNWNNAVDFSLPDDDVFTIDASAATPVETGAFPHVGTILFNMIANPVTGNVYVTNTDARNEVRFEGTGILGGSSVRGHLHEARVTVLDIAHGGVVVPRHLNKQINYAVVPSPPGVKELSLATPMGLAIDSAGATLYVAAFGSSKIGVYDVSSLEDDSFDPATVPQISVSGGGPSGLILDEANGRLYALTRFNDAVAVIDTGSKLEIDSLPLHNPEPPSVVQGRPFLYDAELTSSNGEASCGGCHVFGDFDSLAWDLGDPDSNVITNVNPFRVAQPPAGLPVIQSFPDHHPMKGPMTTQSLRGLANAGPMHWRGDRSGGNDPGGDPLDEDAAFKHFNVAFAGLLGRSGPLTADEMQKFTDFALQITYPPNPIRALDNSLTPDEQAGRDFFMHPPSQPSDVFQPCHGCHQLDPAQGFFGTDGFSSFENEPQQLKIAHLRNAYQKVGMFGMPDVAFFNQRTTGFLGPQVRGFGFLHDGSVDTVFRFLNAVVFNQHQFVINLGGFPDGPSGGDPSAGDPLRRQVESFILAFDSNLKPIVGQQITLTDTNAATVGARIDLLLTGAAAGDCDVAVKGVVNGAQRGWYRLADGSFQSDRAAEAPITDTQLRLLAATPGQDLTYTAVPVGSGQRIGVNRDGDCAFDGDEIDSGTNPASGVAVIMSKPKLRVARDLAPAGDERFALRGNLELCNASVTVDPLTDGFSFTVSDSSGTPIFTRVIPPGAAPTSHDPGWKVNGKGTRWVFKDKTGLVAGGVVRVVVIDKTAHQPGLYKIKVVGKRGNFQVDPNDLPLRATAVVDTVDPCLSKLCGQVAFNADGQPRPACAAKNGGKTILCR